MPLIFMLLSLCQEPQAEQTARQDAELKSLREELSRSIAAERKAREDEVAKLLLLLEESRQKEPAAAAAQRFHWGGYGEQHFNLPEGGGAQFDIHRFVFYFGYDFSDSIQLHSEFELEHGFVEDDNGELAIEQLYTDFRLAPSTHLWVGRVLAPLGIVNLRHEPPSFNGVERPSVETLVLPSTWYVDGLGISSEFTPALRYQAFLTSSMDGTGFSALEGIRGGRQEERPSANELGLSGRLDFYPLDSLATDTREQSWRIGLSGFYGGLDNGDEGVDPGVDAELSILSLDTEYSIDRLDLRAVGALEHIDGAAELSSATGESISSVITGWYVEAAWHWLPEAWKTGKHGWSDAIAFARYDDIDTQADVPNGLTADPRGDRNEWTLGIGLYPLPNLVLKADYQWRDSESDTQPHNQFNLGIGWSF